MVDELLSQKIQLVRCSRGVHFLILKAPMVSDAGKVGGSFAPSLGDGHFLKTGTGDQEVDEVAVESRRRTLKALESGSTVRFTSFELGDCRLTNTHTCGQLGPSHAQGVPNGAHPASVRSGFLSEGTKPLQPAIQPAPRSTFSVHELIL
jgi:hypothetical protein